MKGTAGATCKRQKTASFVSEVFLYADEMISESENRNHEQDTEQIAEESAECFSIEYIPPAWSQLQKKRGVT